MSAESRSQLRNVFGDALYDQAQRLVDSGCVIEARVLQAGKVVAGIVSDEGEAQKHRVYIRRPTATDGNSGVPPAIRIEGECNCGARITCVHIAAVSIAAAQASTRVPSVERSPLATAPMSPLTMGSGQRLYYVLLAGTTESIIELRLSIWVSQTAPGGRPDPAGACRFAPRAVNAAEFPRYVDAQDRNILSVFAGFADGPWPLRAAEGTALLRSVLATGRCYWGSLAGPALRAGDSRQPAFDWSVLSNGKQQLRASASGSILTLLDLDPAQYIDTETGECGLLELRSAAPLLRELARRGDIAPEEIESVSAQLAAAQLPRLRALIVERQACVSLAPQLMLSAAAEPQLYFLYNGLAIDDRRLQVADACVRQVRGDAIYEIERDHEAEQRFRAQLKQVLPSAHHREAWLEFQMQSLPSLYAAGWHIEVDARFPYRIAIADDWYADVQHNAHDPWFSLQLGVLVEGRHVNLLPSLVHYLQASMQSDREMQLPELVTDNAECFRRGDHWFVRLDDGRYLPIPIERMQRIAHTLVELFDRDSLDAQGRFALPKTQAARLAQLKREVPLLRADEAALGALVERLTNFSAIERMPAPAGFRATLRTYQEEGLGWLQFLRCYGFGGILADDMGLGKTVQTLAHLALEKAHGRLCKPALIVAPVSAIGNWRAEIERFAPQLNALTLYGARRRESFHLIGTADVVVIGYPSLQLDLELLLQREFHVVILDEAQTIKNPRARVSQAARALRAEHRLCLTGTPLENHLGELWSLCDFLQPGLLGDERQFQRHYRIPIEKHGDGHRAQALAARLAPFLLRRTKNAVAKELPPKTEIIEPIVLDERQRDLYDGVRLAMHRRIRELVGARGLARSQITILDALLKLRQVCCDPRLVSKDAAREQIPSAKLDWLAAALPELVAEGRRILLFSQFTSMLQLIESLLQKLSIPYCLLTGATRRRDEVVERFQSGAVPVFLISLKAGGTALNLTAADTVIHYDPWWNPAVEAQATDRAHRIGQDQPVFAYKLIAQGTIEERMSQLQAQKRALAGQLYDTQLHDGRRASPLSLNAADLEMLLAP